MEDKSIARFILGEHSHTGQSAGINIARDRVRN